MAIDEPQQYTKEILESGKCPECNSFMEKIEWYQGDEVICHSFFDTISKQFVEDIDRQEVIYKDREPKTTEYHCDQCKISYHIDTETFIAEG